MKLGSQKFSTENKKHINHNAVYYVITEGHWKVKLFRYSYVEKNLSGVGI